MQRKMELIFKFTFRLIITGFLITGFFALSAAELKVGQSLVIDHKYNDDIYMSAGEIVFKGSVNGDANLIGGEITLNAKVSQDLNVVGGSVTVPSNVGDDVHLLAGQTTLSGVIKGDVFAAGGEIKILDTAKILGDLYIAGANVKVIGDVKGSVVIAGGKVHLSGDIGGDLNIKGGYTEIAAKVHGKSTIASKKLEIDKKAKFYSDVNYWSTEKVDFKANMAKGSLKVTYDETLKTTMDRPWKLIVFFSLIFLLSVMLTIYVLQRTFAPRLRESSDYMVDNFMGSFGTGILYFIAAPVLILLLTITFVGWPFAVVLGSLYTITFIFARPATSIMLTNYLEKRSGATWGSKRHYFTSFGLYLALAFIGFIPIIGWLFIIVLVSSSVGSIIQVSRARLGSAN